MISDAWGKHAPFLATMPGSTVFYSGQAINFDRSPNPHDAMSSTPGEPALVPGVTLRRAALVAASSLLVMSVLSPVAFFAIYPRLIQPADIAQSIRNLSSHPNLFLALVLCYQLTFIADIVAAWALYIFLKPANSALSLLAAWFRLAYSVMALSALLKLVSAFRLAKEGGWGTGAGSPLIAQVQLLVAEFHYGWGFSLVVFGVHLLLLGYVVYRSGYVPKLLGILLVINGAGYLVDSLQPFTFSVRYLFVAFFGELIFMVWLFTQGRKLGIVEGIGPGLR